MTSTLASCRECGHEVSTNAAACPRCGAPRPAQAQWDGYGFEWKSRARIAGLPLVHISFKYRANKMPVPAVGVIAIGQFGAGILCISQIGLGVVSFSQITIAVLAVAQIALAYQAIGQIGFVIDAVHSIGQVIIPLVGSEPTSGGGT